MTVALWPNITAILFGIKKITKFAAIDGNKTSE